MKSAEIRQAFLEFFKANDHQIVPSSSLVPMNDPSLLFTNAGMNQFKDVFTGKEKRAYTRATSTQRVVRAGGKHNDLDNVGYTARHHTFFEMLGNFSFGDYFKREAIAYAWEFLTEVLELPPEKLWVTVYKDDSEAEKIWLQDMGIDPSRFSKLDEDNFWSMGDTGPCGPSTEIFYDHGSDVAGGPPGSPDEDGDRYIEIWNLVFMQFDRQQDGSFKDLPMPCVDTGLGLERLAAILQGVHSNYSIDTFQNLIQATAKICACNDTEHDSLKVIADHIRSCSFLIADGVLPSNEGRGYVLRRIIRRAVRHGHKLGAEDVFFYKLVPSLLLEMAAAYPVLAENQAHIEKTLRLEEEQFLRTLDQGMSILEAEIAQLKGEQLSGAVIFKLYDTYGFPVDLTADVAREKGLRLDMKGFDSAMAAQKQAARSASSFIDFSDTLDTDNFHTDFKGYDSLSSDAEVRKLFKGTEAVETLQLGEEGIVICDQTAFYAESGGQVGDHGRLLNELCEVEVSNCTKQNHAYLHHVRVVSGALNLGDRVQTEVNSSERINIAAHHSATHLLHAALRKVLGEHVTQKGSLVDKHKLRFDFSHYEALKPEELKQLEVIVNQHILANGLVTTEEMSIDSAKKKGATALFGEKYDDQVRVLSMGQDNFSMELCGGTHVNRTGDLGAFVVLSEQAVSSGVRRIEALSGEPAINYLMKQSEQLAQVAALLKSDPDNISESLTVLIEKNKHLEKSIDQLKRKFAGNQVEGLLETVENVCGVSLLVQQVDVDPKALRDLLDQLKNKLSSGVIVLAVANTGKTNLIVGVTKDLCGQLKAGELVNYLAQQLGGKGGGRPDMAQAGAPSSEGLEDVLKTAHDWLQTKC